MSQRVSIVNASTALKDGQVELVLPALQQQISQDFAPVWGIDAYLKFVPQGETPMQGDWQLIVLDNSDQAGALGYHDFTADGQPLGKVFAGTDIQYGESWMNTISHELMEMLVDPEINLCALTGNKLYAYEVCDAVEDDSLSYKVGDVLLSDFVYPSWFSPNGQPPYDHAGHVAKPFALAPGGYISIMEVYSLGWKQVSEDPAMPARRAPVGSRRERRNAPRESLKRSLK